MRNWSREDVTILVDDERSFAPLPGIVFTRTRRPLADFRGTPRGALPVCRIEPAALLFAGYAADQRTGIGLLAAVVQQRLSTPDDLSRWLERMRPLRRARPIRRALADFEGGAQSVTEIDVRRVSRRFDLPLLQRQRTRVDRDGRRRFTDCEWRLPLGRVLVLEVYGAFHHDTEQYDADLRRQRRLASSDVLIVRCGARELRDDPGSVAADLAALGLGRSCA